MPRGPALTEYEIGQIDLLNQQGLSNRSIATKIKRSPRVVNNYLSNPVEYNKKKRSGRKSKLSARDRRGIIKKASNSSISCKKIIDDLCLKVSRWTINRALQDSEIFTSQKKKSSPALTEAHKQYRLEWSREHMTWNLEWQKMVWSDEKKFNLDGPDGFNYYWHDLRKEKCFSTKRNNGGGSVMIWASFGYFGKSEICFIDSRLNAKRYREILKNHLVDIGHLIGGSDWLFQQDNAPVHRAKANKPWFNRNKIKVIKWPSLSPDLNPIENLWGLLARRVYAEGKQFSSKEELKKAITREWSKITLKEIRDLIASMPDRVYDCIRLGGCKTKY
jgi:transposase